MTTEWRRKGVKVVPEARGKKVTLEPYQRRRFETMAREGYEVREMAASFGMGDGWVRDYAARHGIVLMDEKSRAVRAGMARAKFQQEGTAR